MLASVAMIDQLTHCVFGRALAAKFGRKKFDGASGYPAVKLEHLTPQSRDDLDTFSAGRVTALIFFPISPTGCSIPSLATREAPP
jgi:hypothetical protein